ncbi:MAG: hypothetical protein FWF25_05155 [Propionibacteriaceae bacterium]|nr:hypothetical protein [Propionibacteriaceae bacterium]
MSDIEATLDRAEADRTRCLLVTGAGRATKQAVALGHQTDIDTGAAIESAQFASCFGTQDQVEPMGAFMGKRPLAPFTGC